MVNPLCEKYIQMGIKVPSKKGCLAYISIAMHP